MYKFKLGINIIRFFFLISLHPALGHFFKNFFYAAQPWVVDHLDMSPCKQQDYKCHMQVSIKP